MLTIILRECFITKFEYFTQRNVDRKTLINLDPRINLTAERSVFVRENQNLLALFHVSLGKIFSFTDRTMLMMSPCVLLYLLERNFVCTIGTNTGYLLSIVLLRTCSACVENRIWHVDVQGMEVSWGRTKGTEFRRPLASFR